MSLIYHEHRLSVLQRQGVGLVEILIAIVVMSVLTAIILPGMNASMTKNRLEKVAIKIQSDLFLAREKAIARGGVSRVVFDFKRSSYLLDSKTNSQWIDLRRPPFLCRLSSTNPNSILTIEFDRFGRTNSDLLLVIHSHCAHRALDLNALKGKAELR